MTEQSRLIVGADRNTYRLTQRDYMLLADSGAFATLAKVELIEGVIYAVNAQYSRHARIQTLLFRALVRACDGPGLGVQPWLEASVSVAEDSMPQPDIFLAARLPDEGPVPAQDVALVIEIADSSLDFDLGRKAITYASSGIAEYWVADAESRIIHQMWAPTADGYAEKNELAFGDVVSAATIETLQVETAGL